MDPLDTRFADCLHYATHRRRTGEPFETAIFNTTIYALPGEPQGAYQYARWANPTWTALEEVLSLLEDAETLIFPSGMAAVASVLYSQLRPGDQVLLPSDGYYTVRTAAGAPVRLRPWSENLWTGSRSCGSRRRRTRAWTWRICARWRSAPTRPARCWWWTTRR